MIYTLYTMCSVRSASIPQRSGISNISQQNCGSALPLWRAQMLTEAVTQELMRQTPDIKLRSRDRIDTLQKPHNQKLPMMPRGTDVPATIETN
jgi:hypothetical protein